MPAQPEIIPFLAPTGRTLKVEVIQVVGTSLAARYDWDDATFKAAGWTTRQQPMTEDATTPGLYSVFLDAHDQTVFPDGDYLFVFTDTAVAQPISVMTVLLVGGRLNAVEPLLCRFALVEGAQVEQTVIQQTVTGPDGVVRRTVPVSDDGVTQQLGPST